MQHLDTLTDTQRDAIAYACRYAERGTIPSHRAVEFYGRDGAVYRVQADGMFRLVRDPQHWQGNRWHRVARVPHDARAAVWTTGAAPSCMQVDNRPYIKLEGRIGGWQ